MSLFEPAATTFGDACDASLGRGDKLDAVAMEASNATALMSIAISLKRIADEICGVPYDPAPGADNSKHCTGITAGIQLAIEQAIAAASQRV